MKIIGWEIKNYAENGPDGYALGTADTKDVWGKIKTVKAWIKVVTDDNVVHIIPINRKGDWNGLYKIVPVKDRDLLIDPKKPGYIIEKS